MNCPRLAAALALGLLSAACAEPTIPDPVVSGADLDAELRQRLGGIFPISELPPQNPALVDLGKALMFDKILSGNRDISCATCHLPSLHGADGLSLSIGTGGSGLGPARTLGPGRRFVPRNAPSLLDQGLRSTSIFWDGRVSGSPAGPFSTPAKPALPPGMSNILIAQAMFPVLSREEMRGDPGDLDVFGNVNELAQIADTLHPEIWRAVMRRLLAIPEYVGKFAAAFPAVPPAGLGFQHAAAAIAAFETEAFTRINTPFDRYLNRDDAALTVQEKRGGILFFGDAGCASCHNGPLLGGQGFRNDGVPQMGPGVGKGAPLDHGHGEVAQPAQLQPFTRFQFRVPPLRNVELTAPYMHNGVYPTLEAVVTHYNDVPTALRTYDVSQLAPMFRGLYRGDEATITAVMASLDGRLRPLGLSDEERGDLVAFLKSLTDPAARDLSALVPGRVPSGLPVDF